MNAGRRTISIAELNMKKRIVFDSKIAGFAAMGWEPDRLQIMSNWHLCYNQHADKSEGKKKFTCSGLLSFETPW